MKMFIIRNMDSFRGNRQGKNFEDRFTFAKVMMKMSFSRQCIYVKLDSEKDVVPE